MEKVHLLTFADTQEKRHDRVPLHLNGHCHQQKQHDFVDGESPVTSVETYGRTSSHINHISVLKEYYS